MKYFFSGPSKHTMAAGARNILLTFASHKNAPAKYLHRPEYNLIIDSGAFTVWNSGGHIDIEEYIAYCKTGSPKWAYMNLDVMPELGAGQKDLDRCVEASKENFVYIQSKGVNVLPVYHNREDINVLKWYMERCGYIAISPMVGTPEPDKRKFLNTVFRITRDKWKCHGLGYSSFEGLTMFPFYTVDSISYVRTSLGGPSFFNMNKELAYLHRTSVQKFLDHERFITELWKERGIEWKD